MHTTTEIIDNLALVNIEISSWSARKKLSTEDLRLAAGSELPPEQLATLGSKRVINPEQLRPFNMVRRRAEREALAVGIRMMGGYAVPINQLDGLVQKLHELRDEYLQAKDVFLGQYNRAVETWIDINPGWENVIRRSVESVHYVERRIDFRIQVFRVQPVQTHQKGLEEEVKGLGGQLRKELRQQLKEVWETSFEGRTEVGQKSLGRIKGALNKAKGLMFVDGGLGPLVQTVEDTLNSLPKSGKIAGTHFAALCGAIHILGDIPEAARIKANPPSIFGKAPEVEPEEDEDELDASSKNETVTDDSESDLVDVEPEPEIDIQPEPPAPTPPRQQVRKRAAVKPPCAWF